MGVITIHTQYNNTWFHCLYDTWWGYDIGQALLFVQGIRQWLSAASCLFRIHRGRLHPYRRCLLKSLGTLNFYQKLQITFIWGTAFTQQFMRDPLWFFFSKLQAILTIKIIFSSFIASFVLFISCSEAFRVGLFWFGISYILLYRSWYWIVQLLHCFCLKRYKST